MCRTTCETPWAKLHNLFGMGLTTDVTLLFPSAVNYMYSLNFYVAGVDYEIKLINEYLLY